MDLKVLALQAPALARLCMSLWVAVTLLTLPACESYVPQPLEPPAELRLLALRTEASIAVDQQLPWQRSWFPLETEVQFADGLTIGEANALALFYSPAVLKARAEARVASAQVLQAGLLSNPELFFGPRITTQDSEFISPGGISWELPLWGKRAAERDAAAALLTSRRLDAIEVELDTLARVREFFIRLGRLRREESVLAAVSTSSLQIVTWVEGLRSAGQVDAMVLFLARTERDEASAALEGVRIEAVRVRRELLAVLGLLPSTQANFIVDSATPAVPDLPVADSDAFLRLPALRAAEAAYASAEAALRLAISEQYPDIRFGPEFEDDRGDPSIGFGLGITLPLFDRNEGGIAAAEQLRRKAREHYRATLLRASHAEAEARDELAGIERLMEIHSQGAMQDADEAARVLEIRIRVGPTDIVEVLTAQRAIARARARMLELEEKAAIARLRAAVAGGLAFERPLPETPLPETNKEVEK